MVQQEKVGSREHAPELAPVGPVLVDNFGIEIGRARGGDARCVRVRIAALSHSPKSRKPRMQTPRSLADLAFYSFLSPLDGSLHVDGDYDGALIDGQALGTDVIEGAVASGS